MEVRLGGSWPWLVWRRCGIGDSALFICPRMTRLCLVSLRPACLFPIALPATYHLGLFVPTGVELVGMADSKILMGGLVAELAFLGMGPTVLL